MAGIAIVVMGMFTSCGSPPPAATGPSIVRNGALAVGSLAPLFRAQAYDGSSVDLGTSSSNVVLVNFFATWCTNCRSELPLLQRTYVTGRARGLVVVAVDYNDSGDAKTFLRDNGVTFAGIADPADILGSAYGVTDVPMTAVIDRHTRIAAIHRGQLDPASLNGILAPLLAPT